MAGMTRILVRKVGEELEPEQDQRLVWGEVYAPNRPDVHGEFMSADDIRNMAHEFLRRKMQDQIDIQHDNKVRDQLTIVESFIAREGDPDFIAGSWVVCCYVEDDVIWKKIKNQELNGFSVEALVIKEPQEREIEVPDVVTGKTTEDAGHSHTFKVTYNSDGSMVGGVTDVVKSHVHRIVAGTITEDSQGHRHRFSAVDNLEIL